MVAREWPWSVHGSLCLRTSTPPEPNHVQTTRDQTTATNYTLRNKVPCGAAYIIWPRKAVSLDICTCQYCTPTKPNTFSTDHAPPRNTTSYRQAATNCSTLPQRRHFTARPLLLQLETPHNSALVSIRIAQVGVCLLYTSPSPRDS